MYDCTMHELDYLLRSKRNPQKTEKMTKKGREKSWKLPRVSGCVWGEIWDRKQGTGTVSRPRSEARDATTPAQRHSNTIYQISLLFTHICLEIQMQIQCNDKYKYKHNHMETS